MRRELRRRQVTVAAVEQLSPNMIRIHLQGDDLRDFESAGCDDHIKLSVPDPSAEGGSAMRDYTPRRFDTGAGTLMIDFAIHDAGPATRWAMEAKAGDTLRFGGPRGSQVVTDDFDWYLLVGDETALPSIGRRLEELRPGVPVTAVIAVEEPGDCVGLPEREGLVVSWSPRVGEVDGDAERLRALIVSLPPGEGYVWIGAEAQVARALRVHVLDTLGHPKEWSKAAGYWTQGIADSHETITD